MIRNLNLRPTRSVAFAMQTYTVPLIRTRPLRHRIYATKNIGFSATPTHLVSGQGQITLNGDRPVLSHTTRLDFNHRRFVAEPNSNIIRFSSPYEPTDFDTEPSAGSFSMDQRLGNVIGFAVFGKLLLIVCAFGLATLDATFDASGFTVNILSDSYKEIVPGTTQVLGDSIFFMTLGGMCRVIRNRLQLLDIDVEFDPGIAYTSQVLDNRYVLGGMPQGSLVIEKFFDSHFYVNNLGTYVWESDMFSLSYAASRQFLKQIRLRTSGPLNIVISNEIRSQHLTLQASNDVQRINVNLKGEAFKLRIETDRENVRIDGLVAVIGFGR